MGSLDDARDGRVATLLQGVGRDAAAREAHDIRLGSAPQGETSTGLDGPDDPDDRGTTGEDPGTADDPGGPARRLDDVPIGTSLEGVPGLVGRRVRVAGALRVIDTPLLTLDDGSGRGLVRLLDFAPTFDPPLHLGEVVNVTGTVATRDVGGWEIVASANGVLRASRLTVAGSSPSPSMPPNELPSASAATDAAGPGSDTETGVGGLLRALLALVVGLGIAALLALAGGLAVAGYRRRTRRRSAVAGPDGGPRTNERA